MNRLTKGDLNECLSCFKEAIEQDPEYALAYVGLADTYLFLGVHKELPPMQALESARKAAHQALAIDASLGEAHTSLGLAKLWYEFDWPGASRELKRALELTPNDPNAHRWHGNLLGNLGRGDEALQSLRKALELDPLSPSIHFALAHFLYCNGRNDEAIVRLERILELVPEHSKAYGLLGKVHTQKGAHEQALRFYERAIRLSSEAPKFVAGLAHAHSVAGRRAEARELLDELLRQADDGTVSSFNIAIVYVGLGETESALDWLERSHAEHSIALGGLAMDPMFASLKAHPRFRALLRRLDLS